jgi:CheY-specific phosphatase CheX
VAERCKRAETLLLAEVIELFRGVMPEADREAPSVGAHDVIVGTIGFGGAEARGAITLFGTAVAWRQLVPLAMGVDVSEGTLCDSVGELANMLAGRFRNAFLRLGIEILVATPIATRGTEIAVHTCEVGTTRWQDLALGGAGFRVRLDLSLSDGFDFAGHEASAVDPNEQDLLLF